MDQHTNTRTIDVALNECIGKLEGVQQTEQVQRLLVEAREYRSKIAMWETEAPDREEQQEVIQAVMKLIARAMPLTRELPPA